VIAYRHFIVLTELLKMSDQFLGAREAHEVVADHFKGSLRRFATRPDIDQQQAINAQ